METQDFLSGHWHAASFRVRYQESDQMGVVYHSNYLIWFEIGRTEMLRGLGFTYLDLENSGLLLPVLSAELKFKRSAKYDDTVAVYTRMTSFTPLRLVLNTRCAVWQGRGSRKRLKRTRIGLLPQGFKSSADGELLVSGFTGHAWVNREFKPVRLDRALPEIYGGILNALKEDRGRYD